MEKRTLAFEIGTEEIPAFDLAGAVKQLSTMVPSLLDDAALPLVVLSLLPKKFPRLRKKKMKFSRVLLPRLPLIPRAIPPRRLRVLRVARV